MLRNLAGRLVVFLLIVLALLIHDNWRNIYVAFQGIASPGTFTAMAGRIETDLRSTRRLVQSGAEHELRQSLKHAQSELRQLEQKQAQQEREKGFFARINPLPELSPDAMELRLQISGAATKVAVFTQAYNGAKGEWAADRAVEHFRKDVKDAASKCNATAGKVRAFDQSSRLSQVVQSITADSRADLMRENRKVCEAWRQKRDALVKALNAQERARSEATAFRRKAVSVLEGGLSDIRSIGNQQDAQTLRGYWTKQHMNDVLLRAAAGLLLIILIPYLIRALFYYLLAPVAERRRAIRLSVPGSHGAQIPMPQPSAISVKVLIGDSEELLVREGFLHASSLGGEKRWVALLDWRHPLASLITGLTGLIRVRGGGQLTTISAGNDPFAEVTELIIPAASALILHPRALVAVVQPVGKPMRIASHWRLFSLNAWLTLQLRFLVFHGPVRIVIRGGRGVRVERAERGCVFAQDQLVGFSADLDYSVTRNETFIPYLRGRTSLFRDRVDQGRGMLIVEEAPLSARGGERVKQGLEGAFDAALKVFGI